MAITHCGSWLRQETFITYNKTTISTGLFPLESMSPNEFHLRFRNIDNLGHLTVELKVRIESLYQKDYSDLIKVAFEIDPTSLPKIICELNEIKTYANKELS